jgi:hypothetical protein
MKLRMRCQKCGKVFERKLLKLVKFRKHSHHVCFNCLKRVGHKRKNRPRHRHVWKTVLTAKLYINGKPAGSLEELVCNCGKRVRKDENWSNTLTAIERLKKA